VRKAKLARESQKIKKDPRKKHMKDHSLSESTRVTQPSANQPKIKLSPYEDLKNLELDYDLSHKEMWDMIGRDIDDPPVTTNIPLPLVRHKR
jgi:hypothetical protein